MKIAIAFSLFAAFASAFSAAPTGPRRSTSLSAIEICEGVEFGKLGTICWIATELKIHLTFFSHQDTISREWRCKWSPDNDKKSLVEAQKALESVLADVKAVDGVKGVQRVVCGGCLDFKVVTSLPADKFGEWEAKGFEPESKFIEKLKSIDGLSVVETQTYTVSSLIFSFVGTPNPLTNDLDVPFCLRTCPCKIQSNSVNCSKPRISPNDCLAVTCKAKGQGGFSVF